MFRWSGASTNTRVLATVVAIDERSCRAGHCAEFDQRYGLSQPDGECSLGSHLRLIRPVVLLAALTAVLTLLSQLNL